MLEIALASQSPRRRDLLSEAGYEFRVFPVKVSENIDENLNPQQLVSHLATLKLTAALVQHKELKQPGFLVLTADTLVVLNGKVLGKPKNISQAQQFLRAMSGKTHTVITGLSLKESGATKLWSGVESTTVQFRTLSDDVIMDYISTGEPMDKAGAYGMQGEGRKFVSSYTGSESNVIGLPMELLAKALKENGWSIRRRTTQ